jgi:hypothetical protein
MLCLPFSRRTRNSAGNQYRRDCVLKDKLLLVAALENQGKFVKTPDAAGKLYAAQQVDCHLTLVFPGVVEKALLDILGSLVRDLSFSTRLIAHA